MRFMPVAAVTEDELGFKTRVLPFHDCGVIQRQEANTRLH